MKAKKKKVFTTLNFQRIANFRNFEGGAKVFLAFAEKNDKRKKKRERRKRERKKKSLYYVKAKKESRAKKEKRKKFHVEQICGGEKLGLSNKLKVSRSKKNIKKTLTKWGE